MLPTTQWKRKGKEKRKYDKKNHEEEEEEEDMWDPLIDYGRLEWQNTLQKLKKSLNVAYI
jgi:hypothetical protein